MTLIELKPRKALNKAFLKVKPSRNAIEGFKSNLVKLIEQINEAESEEFHKNLVSHFLRETYYASNHFINTKGRNDLVIHNSKDAKSSVGVILEADAQKAPIIERVKKILAANQPHPHPDPPLEREGTLMPPRHQGFMPEGVEGRGEGGIIPRLEAEIDQLVYKLYDLTPEEIAIVEGEG